MTKTIAVNADDLIEIYLLIEEINDLFHQPLKYSDAELVSNFADTHYPQIKRIYYEVLWEYLPEEYRHSIEAE